MPRNILEGHWETRKQALFETLKAIPFTNGQRADIEHHFEQLEKFFKQANVMGDTV